MESKKSKKIRSLKLSTKFIGVITIVLLMITVMDIMYSAKRERRILQKDIKEWTFLFAENVRVILNTLMREGKMDLRFAMFEGMAKELDGLGDVRIIRGKRVDEIFQEINNRDVIPGLEKTKESLLNEISRLEGELQKSKDKYEREDIEAELTSIKEDIKKIQGNIASALKTKEIDFRERPQNELDEKVLREGRPLYRFDEDKARVLIPYVVKEKGCRETSGCHKYAREGDVLGAISLELSIEKINREIRLNNLKLAGFWVLRLITVIAVIAILLKLVVTRELKQISAYFKKFSSGAMSVRIPIKGNDEVGELSEGFNEMADELESVRTELDRRLLEIYVLYNMSKVMNTTFETDQLLKRLAYDISNNIGIDKIMIMCPDEAGKELFVASSTGFGELDLSHLKRRIDEGFYGSVASSLKSRLVKEVAKEADIRPEDIPAPHINSILAVPFARRGEILGLICAYKEKPAVFEPSEMNLFEALAENLAVALENTRLFEKTKMMALTDGLTGLYNKRFFIDALDMELAKAIRYKRNLSVLMMDIDDFKHYNDTNGHPAGDDLLIMLADLVKTSVREVDLACRYGGEEFVVIMPETGKKGAIVIAERLVEKIRTHAFPYRESQPFACISISLGLASFPDDEMDAEKLLKRADEALYEAKKGGKNRFVSA